MPWAGEQRRGGGWPTNPDPLSLSFGQRPACRRGRRSRSIDPSPSDQSSRPNAGALVPLLRGIGHRLDAVVFDGASAVRSQIGAAPYFVASPVKEPNVQIGARGHVRFIDGLRVLLGSFKIGRVEISGRQSLMTADGDNLKTPNHLSLARGDPGDDRGLGLPRCRGRGQSWRLLRHLIGHDRASLFRQLAGDQGARGGRRLLDSGNTHAAHGALHPPRLAPNSGDQIRDNHEDDRHREADA